MKHIDLNGQNEVVKQFFLSLPVDPDGSIVELNGHAVARVVPVVAEVPPATDSAWTEAQNTRRCLLIDRKIEGTITPKEAQELEALQQAMLRYRRKVAPLPLEATRRLHRELLSRARTPDASHP